MRVKRRCLYHWLDYPDRERELAIVRGRACRKPASAVAQVATFVGRLRSQPFANAFQRAPGIAESVEWAKALVALDTLALDPEVVPTPPASCSSSARTWRRSRAISPPTCCKPETATQSRSGLIPAIARERRQGSHAPR
jgi:MoxR-like ATPase